MKQKILLFDLENSPNLGWVWQKYEQDVMRFDKEGVMLSFAYKWLGEKTVKAHALPDFRLYKKDKLNDTELVKVLHKLFNEADVIIAHHGDNFDIKKSNAYFAKAGLLPPTPYKTVDTRKVAKRYFRFNSNKLDDLGQYLDLGKKLPTGGIDLWFDCMAGDKKAWKKMVAYNKQDVVLLEKVYLKLLPWITNHPDVGIDLDKCKNCAGSNFMKRGISVQRNGRYQRLQCSDCGAWDRFKIKLG